MGAFALRADPPRPVVEPVSDLFSAAPFDQQRLGGLLASRMQANTEGYLEHIPIQQIAYSLDAAGDTSLGKSAGLLLEASANSYEYGDDAQLKKVMGALAKLLISHQKSDGYIGPYAPAQRWNREDVSSQSAILLGLTAYYRVVGNDDALIASRRLGNALVLHLSRGKGAVTDARECIRPLLELFRLTNDTHYLAFCRKLAQSSLAELGSENGVYSFLSFLSGLVDLYQLSGDDAYEKAAISAWRRVRSSHLAITGVPNSKEPSSTGCLTEAWLRLNLDLFRVSGQPEYAQEVQRTVYNQLLGSQNGDNGKIDAEFLSTGSKTATSNIQPCSAAVSLGLSEIPEIMWGRLGAGVAVLSYQPGRASIRTRRRADLQLYMEGEYPRSGALLLHVEPKHDAKFPLQLLVPEWTKSFKAEIGSTVLFGKPGKFLTVEREWKRGDSIKISLDMTAATLSDNDHRGEVVIQRGPEILCLVKGRSTENDISNVTIPVGPLSLKLVDEDDVTYELQGDGPGKTQELTFVPLAEAETPYRLWIKVSD
jgi:hypothetical protein